MKTKSSLPLIVALSCLVFASALAQKIAPTTTNTSPRTVSQAPARDGIVLPAGFHDPIEPFNRAMWGFNKGFLTWAVRPFSRGYRCVVIKPVRTGIGRMGKNLAYPDRLVNNLLQGEWAGSGEETLRCLCNTVLGLGGFFDVATPLGVPKHDADFGQTFRKWGWRPGFYLMLPVFGPSDDRDAIGLAGDTAAEPQTYFSPNELALAELFYQHGFSAVCISSTFHPEFMEKASTTDLPSYPPADVRDLNVALTQIDHRLNAAYGNRLGSRSLMGCSVGAFQLLCLAAQAATNGASSVKFDRYVAIDSPVNLRYSPTNLDQFYLAPLAWPAEKRTADIENTLLKVAALSEQSPKPGADLPFNAIESRFLIGLDLRLTLRDVIFSSQMRHNQGVLKQPLKKSRRHEAYDEIMQYSFGDYINQFAIPYDKSRGIDMTNPEIVKKATDLRAYTDQLKASRNIRVIANRNDFLLSTDDVAWVEATFDPSEVTLFEHGGHLGNLSQANVQKAVLQALDGLSEPVRVRIHR